MANDLVVRVGARLDDFEAALNRAGSIADDAVSSIEQKFSSINPGAIFSNIGTAIAIGAASIPALTALVAQLNKQLDDMAKTAERAGLSFRRFQELQFASNASGVSSSNFGAAIEAFAQNITTAQFKANDLKRVFDANGVSIKDANGKLKDTDTLLTSAVDIIKRAPTIQDALQIGGFLGLSKELSQSIFDAGDGFLKLASQANAAGAVIDDATIEKAQVFTREWNKATALWGASFKAQLNDFLPLINDAVAAAQKLLSVVKVATDALGSIKDFAFAPNIDTASISKLNGLLDQYTSIRDKLAGGQALNPIELFQASNIPNDGKLTVDAVQKVIDQVQERIKAFNANPQSRIRVTPADASVNPGPKLPEQAQSQFETVIDQIAKRTANIRADTAATFENNAAQQQFRAEFQLLNAIIKDNGEVTQAQLEEYEKLRASMSATQALQQSGIVLTQAHADAFHNASEGIKAAVIASNAARESLNKLNSASSQLGSALSTAFADAVVEGKNLNDVLGNLLKTLEKAAINSIFSSLFNPGVGGGPSPFLSIFGIGHNAGGTDNWTGGPTWVGENGPEIVNLPRGSQVVPNNVATRGGGAGGSLTVNLIEDSSRAGQVNKSAGNNGGIRLDVMVDSITAKNAANRGSATSAALDNRRRVASR